MADTTILPLLQPKKEEKIYPQNILGGAMGWLDETFELTVSGQGAFVNEGPLKGQDLEQLQQMPETEGLPATGSIEFRKKTPEASLIEEQRTAVVEAESIMRKSRAEFIALEEIRFGEAGMSEEERNRRLKVNTSFAERNTQTAYHRAVIYAQLKMEFREAQKRVGGTQIPSPAKQAHALETQFEGGFGKMGSGTASLSSASGAVG